MSIEIRVVENKSEMKTFVKVPYKVFKGNSNWVPQLIRDEMETFDKNRNPCFEGSEARFFLAYKDGRPVGRIAAILSHKANKKFNTKNIRFGWFDTIDDYEVAESLLQAAENWGKEMGMETITGPQGFTDLDPEGMLVEGFDQLATVAVYYNHPYYPEFVNKFGFEKEIDYVEYKTMVPHEEGIPERLLRLCDRIQERSSLRILKFKNKKELMSRADEIMTLMDEAYEQIYGAVPLTKPQLQYFIKKYFPFVDKEMIQVVVNKDDAVVAFMISMTNLSRAFQKANGRLFPFGWFHLLMGLRQHKVIDFYLAGIKKSYQGLGADLMMVMEIAKLTLRKGFIHGESNPELETNTKIQAQWKHFSPVQHKRRRIYKKRIG